MTNRDAPHDFDPKHRIIGAIVVVALAVIFVPMILSEREAPSDTPRVPPTDQAAQGAAPETKVVITKVPPPPAMSEPIKAVEPAKASPTPGPSSAESAKATATPAKPAVTAAKAPPSNGAKQPAASSASGWVVQVGTFSNTANATKLEQKLRAQGQPVRAEQLQIENGKAVRLRVGPFQDRATAVKAQERIQKDVGVKGVVLAFP